MRLLGKVRTAVRIRNSIDNAATDEAFYHAYSLVIRATRSRRYPLIEKGIIQFRKSLEITHQKAPDQAYEFVQFFKDAFWETYQKVMTTMVPVGTWNRESQEALFECLLVLTEAFPDPFQSTEEDRRVLCSFTIEVLDDCQVGINQAFAQTVLEVILILWFQYLFADWREAERSKLQEN